MKKILNVLAIAVTALFLTTQMGLAQHSEHHNGEKADTTKSASGSAMMPMHQQMMSGNTTTPRGMMRSSEGQSMEQGSGMMMGGKGMMKDRMMGGKGKMQGQSMMGKCKMMHGSMMGKGMMQGGMGMMAMHDPVFKSLHTYGCPGFLLMSADKLALSEQQISALKAIKTDFQKTAVKNKADTDVAKIELNELLNAASPDFGKVKSKITQISSLEEQLRLDFLNRVIQARKLLSAEQLKTLKSISGKCCKGMMGMNMMKGMAK